MNKVDFIRGEKKFSSLDELKKAGLSALTLDVRGNEGSILSLCKDACDILCGRKEAPGAGRGDDVTRGHFFRGVL